MTFIRYIGVDFTLGLLDCVRYNEDFTLFYTIPQAWSLNFYRV